MKLIGFVQKIKNGFDIWIASYKDTPPISDEEYLTYGTNSQDFLRLEYLQTALQISDASDGEVMLLNPKIIPHFDF